MTPELIARYDQRVPRYTSYPTAPHFSAAVSADTYEEWLKKLDADIPLSLYVHIPFCQELCWYCGCHTIVSNNYSGISHYVRQLCSEISMVSDLLPGPMRVSHMHWGGGTPTALNPADLHAVLSHISRYFRFEEGAESAIEIDPRVLSEEQIAVLAENGVTRASIGVQDFNEKVQKSVNRQQSFEVTEKAVTGLRAAGITKINLDLMYGLPFQSEDSILESAEIALKLRPDRISLFGYAHVPWMKKHQNLLPQESLPDTAERVRQMEAAAGFLMANGYISIGIDHFAHPDDAMVTAQKESRLHRNFQGYTTDEASALIGFGASAIGSLPQGYVQNQTPVAHYIKTIEAGKLATARGIALKQEDRLRRAIIERLMCDFCVDLNQEKACFGLENIDFSSVFSELKHLAQDGLVECKGDKLFIPLAARPLVRLVCAVFDTYLNIRPDAYSKAL